MKKKDILKLLNDNGFRPDVLGKNKKGNYVYRKGFFYTHGNSAYIIAEKMVEKIPQITIIDTRDVWKDFIGGASISKQSHFMVEFNIK